MEKKRTKIVATISDKNCEPHFIRDLHEAGMDVIRINSAHLDIEGALRIIKNTRQVSERIAILIDTKGPEIRTSKCEVPLELKQGDTIIVTGTPDNTSKGKMLVVSLKTFADDVPPGSRVVISDGDIELKALKKEGNSLVCRAENDGLIGSRKSVNVPGVKICLPSVTDRDREFIRMAVENNIDFIAHSFVRSKQDILDVRAELDKYGSDIKIIAKIENQEGIDNLGDILDEAYGVMVARGDLGIEIPYEKIPSIQRMIISRCIFMRKPVIVATQMLHTMITNPRPTRAEISDIASAIYSQTDAVMLSGETAAGKYPVESVKTMTRVAMEVEKNKEKFINTPFLDVTGEVSSHLARMAVEISLRVNAKAIVADTRGGKTIRDMASSRGFNHILAQCYSKQTMRELALSYGVYTGYQESRTSVDEFIHIALTNLISTHDLRDDDLIVVLAGNFSGKSGFSFIEVGTVQYLKDRVNIVEG